MKKYSGVEAVDGVAAALDMALKKARAFIGEGEGFVLVALRQDKHGCATLSMGHGVLTEKGLKEVTRTAREFGFRLQTTAEEGLFPSGALQGDKTAPARFVN